MHTPDYWCVLKINGNDPHYRVFATWSGSYLYGSSWRMNSGIVRVEEVGDHFNFYGSSGSVYHCHKEMYGCHVESHGLLNEALNREKNPMELVDGTTDWLNFDWIITE